MPVTKK